jgi:hypothetical protein
MNIEKIKEIVRRKPLFFLLVSVGYLILIGFLKWKLTPEIDTFLFLIGGVIGVYFLDIAEVFFELNPSPFRSIVFVGAFILVSLFVVTSSGSPLATGLVLSLFLTLLLWQIGQWQISRNLTDWYRMVAGPVEIRTQQWILMFCIGLFLIETFVFIR